MKIKELKDLKSKGKMRALTPDRHSSSLGFRIVRLLEHQALRPLQVVEALDHGSKVSVYVTLQKREKAGFLVAFLLDGKLHYVSRRLWERLEKTTRGDNK